MKAALKFLKHSSQIILTFRQLFLLKTQYKSKKTLEKTWIEDSAKDYWALDDCRL